MIFVLIVALWLFMGWLGWRLTIWWWTQDTDMTVADRRVVRPLLLAGPAMLIAGLIGVIAEWSYRTWPEDDMDDTDIIYPRKGTEHDY